MTFDLSIDRDTGSIQLGENIRFQAGNGRDVVSKALATSIRQQRDHGNGYIWLDIEGILFGDRPCTASLCFYNDKLQQVSWSVSLAGAETEGGWPTREAIDNEIAFARAVIEKQLNVALGGHGEAAFSWGRAWSRFDPKGFLASNGLSYAL